MIRFNIDADGMGVLNVHGERIAHSGEYYVQNLTALQKPQMRKLFKLIRLETYDDLDHDALRGATRYLTEEVPANLAKWQKEAEKNLEHCRAVYMDMAHDDPRNDRAYMNLQTARIDLYLAQTRAKRLPTLLEVWNEVFADDLK